MKKLIFLCLLVNLSFSDLISEDLNEELSEKNSLESEWKSFKELFNKSYNEFEENFRKKEFFNNKRIIKEHNERIMAMNNMTPKFYLKINKYSDLNILDVRSQMNGYKVNLKKKSKNVFKPSNNLTLPEELDWREKGYVSDVKDQGNCGSCWSFSSTGSLESLTYNKNKKKINLSEQNLIDCSNDYGNNGCNGGLMDFAFEYIKENNGIDGETSYPYEAKEGKCRYKKSAKKATDRGFVDIMSKNETALLEAVATIGPVSVAIDASFESFQLYSHGIYFEPECSQDFLDHGVLVVGYGVDKNTNIKYWIVKNSWSKSWGEDGYIKMLRGINLCGIASAASYPKV